MKKITLENGKIVEISEESYKELSNSIQDFRIDNNSSLVETYKYVCSLPQNQEKIKTTENKEKQIYVNKVFADGSVFGRECIFIKCKFSSYCKFGSSCEFGSYCEFSSSCEFGSYCKFGSSCEFGSYCKFGSSCEFSSSCEFGFYCEFSSSCEFGSYCKGHK